jgi:acyl-CoA synthetase (AMP-forming)/AMP-acid ligase II
VIVTHASLMNNLGYIHECFGHNKDSIAITWLPVFHDMGLVDGMLEPIYGGFRCYAMPPHAFLQRPLRWLRAISTYRATHSGGPNFAYELCVDKVTPAQTADLDLRSWRIAYNGAEPIRPSTMAAFGGAFGPCGFRSEAFHPCYGLAEATLKVTGGSATELHPCTVDAVALERGELVRVAPGAPRGRTIASCGTVFRDFELAIVNPESSQAVPEGNIGEIWLSGPSVARGYFGDDLATTEVFEARTADGRGPFLRTGDLGFVLDREVYVTGRLRDLIILAGRNLYPQDIERSAESASSTYVPGSVVAFSTDDGLREHLIVLVEAQRPFHSSEEPAALRVSLDAVRRAVARDNSVDAAVVAVVPMGTLLKTSSGKIRRRACRRAYLAGELPVLASLRHEEALGPA